MKYYLKCWDCYYFHYHIFGQEESDMLLGLDPTERKSISLWSIQKSSLKEVNQCHYSMTSIGIPGISYKWTLGSKSKGRPQTSSPSSKEFDANKYYLLEWKKNSWKLFWFEIITWHINIDCACKLMFKKSYIIVSFSVARMNLWHLESIK